MRGRNLATRKYSKARGQGFFVMVRFYVSYLVKFTNYDFEDARWMVEPQLKDSMAIVHSYVTDNGCKCITINVKVFNEVKIFFAMILH